MARLPPIFHLLVAVTDGRVPARGGNGMNGPTRCDARSSANRLERLGHCVADATALATAFLHGAPEVDAGVQP